MVDLSEAGARLRGWRVEPTPDVSEIVGRRARRRRKRRAAGISTGLVVLAVAASVASLMATGPGSKQVETIGTGTANTAGAAVTASRLEAGQWSSLPPAPIPARTGASIVWTGTEMIVWGGSSGAQGEQLHNDGAAYDPSSRTWRVLPPAPLSPRVGQAAVWTGTLLVIWGGYDQAGPGLHVTADGAVYDPATNAWSMMPTAPLAARAYAFAVWTGTDVLIIGGHPAVQTTTKYSDSDGALYSPSPNIWTPLTTPPAPPGHGLDWTAVVQADQRLLAWSNWTITRPLGPNASTSTSGADLLAYNERTHLWQLEPSSPDEIQGVEQAIWTGQRALVRGTTRYCGGCAGPDQPETTAWYDPATNTWTPITQDPLALDHPVSAWTGAALLSLNTTTTTGVTGPGNDTAFDPISSQWLIVPSAPSTCDSTQPPTWTGAQFILYCPPLPGTNSTTSGLALTPASPPSGLATQGTIYGTLEAIGGPAPASGSPAAGRPLSGHVSATGEGHTYTVAVGQSGQYSLSVPAGTYTITGRSPHYQGGAADCQAQNPTTIAAGKNVQADVACPEK